MPGTIPNGYQWIKDLAPGVSYDEASDSISLNDGTVIPKEMYTVVNDRAYVDPNSFTGFLTSSGYKPLRSLNSKVSWDDANQDVVLPQGGALPKTLYALVNGTSYIRPDSLSKYTSDNLQTMSSVPEGKMAVRDLDPNVNWNPNTNSITLPDGRTIANNQIVMSDETDKAYINPYTMAGYYQPKAITPESIQGFANVAQQAYQPFMDQSYDRLNRLVGYISNKLNASTDSINAQGDRSQRLLQRQESNEANKLTKQAMARGTYTSGVADYGQRKLSEQYAPEYEDLNAQTSAAIANANAEAQKQMGDVAAQGKDLEATYGQQVFNTALQLAQSESQREQQVFTNMLTIAGANDSRTITMAQNRLQNALARTTAIGYVTSDADAAILGVPVGTSSFEAQNAAANRAADLEKLNAQIAANKEITGMELNSRERIAAADRSSSEGIAAANRSSSSSQAGNANDQRLFQQAMAVWEQTGVAPASSQLQAYGIEAGKPWSKSVAEQAKEWDMQQQQNEFNAKQDLANNVAGWTNRYGFDAQTGTEAVYITDGVDYGGAMTRFQQNRDTLKARGVDINGLEKAIKDYYQ